MNRFFMVGLFALCCATLEQADERVPAVELEFASLDIVGRHKATIVGSPRLIDTPNGKAIEFDGQSGLFLRANPLAGLKQFTAEIVFQPYAGGTKEQRFLHFQEDGSENRL